MGRALITGGAGFLGSHLCDLFLSRGHEVICMDNFLTGNPDNIKHLLGALPPRVDFRGLWRSAHSSAEGRLLGKCESSRTARRV